MSIAFALIALVAGTIGTFVFGIYASCVTVVCVVLSIIFAVKKRKKDGEGGIPSIVISIIGLFICGILTLILVSITDVIKDGAEKAGTQYIQNYAEDFKYGVYGLSKHIEKDGVDLNVISEEMDKITKLQ
jgi:hypothetical protein